jgi:hypothetical protein
MTRESEAVLVIGAGAAGLAVAAERQRRGVPAEILERGDAVASSSRQRCDRLRLNTCRWTSTLTGGACPRPPGSGPRARLWSPWDTRTRLGCLTGPGLNGIPAHCSTPPSIAIRINSAEGRRIEIVEGVEPFDAGGVRLAGARTP